MVKFKKDPRKYQGYILFLLIFLVTLLVFLVVTRWVIEGDVQFIVRPRDGSNAYSVSVPLNKIAHGFHRSFSVLLPCPVEMR